MQLYQKHQDHRSWQSMNPYKAPQVPIIRTSSEQEMPTGNFQLPRPQRNPGAVKLATTIFAGAILVLNVLIVGTAAGTGGWGAISMIMLVGPGINLVAGVVGLVLLPAVKNAAAGSSTTLYVAAVVVLPFAAMLIDGMIVKSMNLPGGC